MLGDTIFEVLNELRDARRLRTTLANMARVISNDPKRRAIIILNQPKVSAALIHEEWEAAAAVFKQNIYERLNLVVRHDHTILTVDHADRNSRQPPDSITAHEHGSIEKIVGHIESQSRFSQKRTYDTFYDILRILLVRYFRLEPPITTKHLGEIAGCSYPTVAAALHRLQPYLRRQSDRRVQLRAFPREAWFELVSFSEKVRSTRRYADRSTKPRSPETMIKRLMDLHRDDVAVGGVLGARHYLPKLDLIGTPRLDLTINVFNRHESETLIRSVDAGLVPAERGEMPHVVVHTVNRQASLFERDNRGSIWADQVECLLDLHEARLEAQALEMLDALTPKP